MENKLRSFLTAFFGSIAIFILIIFGYSLINGGERGILTITVNILIYYTVPVFILVLAGIYLPAYFAKRSYLVFNNLYIQVLQTFILLVIMLSVLIYVEGLGSRYLRMGFLNYWLKMMQGFGIAIIYFSLSIPILLKLVKD